MTARDRDERVGLLDTLLDLVVFAPIGLTLDAQDIAPDLARRGRQHTAAARQIGEFAVKAGMRKLEGVVAQMTATAPDPTAGPAPVRAAPTGGERTGEVATTTSPSGTPAPVDADTSADSASDTEIVAGDLPVPDYDLLAASQVVKRLDVLTPTELEIVRRYEEQTRGRRTILNKIARLEG